MIFNSNLALILGSPLQYEYTIFIHAYSNSTNHAIEQNKPWVWHVRNISGVNFYQIEKDRIKGKILLISNANAIFCKGLFSGYEFYLLVVNVLWMLHLYKRFAYINIPIQIRLKS